MYSDTSLPEIERASAPDLDRLLGHKFIVLREGFVRAMDYCGNDDAIVQAARVSYGKGTKTLREDTALIRYLMRKRHTTPFEMCELKLHVRVPFFIWKQWIRHRTANVNEYSNRYSEAIDEMHVPEASEFRIQSKTNRQGSDGIVNPMIGNDLRSEVIRAYRTSEHVYRQLLHNDVTKEQARIVMPLGNYTEAYWKIDLHNLLHFLALRLDEHAQLEIRLFADAIKQIVKAWVPATWKAFEDYRLNAMELTARDILVIRLTNTKMEDVLDENAVTTLLQKHLMEWGWLKKDGDGYYLPRNRERDECQAKLERLQLFVPWRSLPHRAGRSKSAPTPE